MTNTELLVRIRDLHEELSAINDNLKAVDYVDEETIDALGQLVTETCELVDQAKEANEVNSAVPEHHALLERIQQFESEHPRVTRFLSQITDVLAMMGI